MKNVIIDTCVLIHIIRETITGKNCIQAISIIDEDANIIISVVTKAEIGDITTLEDEASVDEIKKALEEFKAEVEKASKQ